MDTNIVSYYYTETRPEHACVWEHVGALPFGAPIRVSVVTLGEIAYGYYTGNRGGDDLATHVLAIRSDFPNPLNVTRHAADLRGRVRARLFKKLGVKNHG